MAAATAAVQGGQVSRWISDWTPGWKGRPSLKASH